MGELFCLFSSYRKENSTCQGRAGTSEEECMYVKVLFKCDGLSFNYYLNESALFSELVDQSESEGPVIQGILSR